MLEILVKFHEFWFTCVITHILAKSRSCWHLWNHFNMKYNQVTLLPPPNNSHSLPMLVSFIGFNFDLNISFIHSYLRWPRTKLFCSSHYISMKHLTNLFTLSFDAIETTFNWTNILIYSYYKIHIVTLRILPNTTNDLLK